MSRVVLVPGLMRSLMDGALHCIDAHRLAGLYSVPFDKCVVWDHWRAGQWRPAADDVLLYPDPTGKYELPARAKELLA